MGLTGGSVCGLLISGGTIHARESLWLREDLDLTAYKIDGFAIAQDGSAPYS